MNDLPPGWELVPFADLGREVRGSVRPEAGTVYELYSVPTYPTGHPEVLRGEEIGSSKRPVEPHDVLLCKINPRINRVWIVAEPTGVGPQIASTEYLVFRVGDPRLSSYLRWYLQSPTFRKWIELHVEGATGSHTRAKSGPILEQLIPLPPIEEQGRIVAAIEEHLSRLDAVVAQLHRSMHRLEHLAAAGTAALAGAWPQQTLAELAELVTKGTTPTTLGFDYVPEGVRFVKAESLIDGRIDPHRCAAVDEPTHSALKRSQLHAGDLLITIAGTLGRVAEVVDFDVPANTNQAVALVRLKDPGQVGFLRRWLASSAGQRQMLTGGRGVGLQNLNLAQIRGLKVPVPTPVAMEAYCSGFDAVVGRVEGQRVACEASVHKANLLRRSILAAAFSGELVPQDSDDEPAYVLLERIRSEREVAAPSKRTRKAKAS